MYVQTVLHCIFMDISAWEWQLARLINWHMMANHHLCVQVPCIGLGGDRNNKPAVPGRVCSPGNLSLLPRLPGGLGGDGWTKSNPQILKHRLLPAIVIDRAHISQALPGILQTRWPGTGSASRISGAIFRLLCNQADLKRIEGKTLETGLAGCGGGERLRVNGTFF